jgi:hypothetical protein
LAKIIRNGKDLEGHLKRIARNMLEKTRDEVYEAINLSINEYYKEFKPDRYERTYMFLRSLVKTEIKVRGNELYCEVKIDEDYLNYAYPHPNKFDPSYPQDYDGRDATGYDVVSWANRKYPNDSAPGGNHGYTMDAGRNEGFWDSAMEEIGDILQLMKNNLKNMGINVV